MRKLLALATFVCAASMSYAQNLQLGVTVGWYLPTGTALKNAFGAQIFTLGFAPVSTSRPSSGSITPTFNIIGADKNGSNFLLVPVTLGYEYHFSGDDSSTSSFIPYARLEAGGSYYNYSINEGGPSNVSGSTIGWVADAQLGVIVSQSIQLSARYYAFQHQNGITFDGLELALTFGLIRL